MKKFNFYRFEPFIGVIFWAGFLGAIGDRVGGWIAAFFLAWLGVVVVCASEWAAAKVVKETILSVNRQVDKHNEIASDPNRTSVKVPSDIGMMPHINYPVAGWLALIWVQCAILTVIACAFLGLAHSKNPATLQELSYPLQDWCYSVFVFFGAEDLRLRDMIVGGTLAKPPPLAQQIKVTFLATVYFTFRSLISVILHFRWLFKLLLRVRYKLVPKHERWTLFFWPVLVVIGYGLWRDYGDGFYSIAKQRPFVQWNIFLHYTDFVNGISFVFVFLVVFTEKYAKYILLIQKLGPFSPDASDTPPITYESAKSKNRQP